MEQEIVQSRLRDLADDLCKYEGLLDDPDFKHSEQDIINTLKEIKKEINNLGGN